MADDNALCPAAQNLPQLTIDKIHDPAIPVIDEWQVFWGNMPLSDYQLAELAEHDVLIDRTRAEIKARGTWVYVGTVMASLGTAISSFGWILYGQDKQPQTVSLPMALGGIALGALGLITITEYVQTPLEPLTAPTPVHRLTRDEVRMLVSQINHRLYRDICKASLETRLPEESEK
ncbi:MAG: hypothetical protein JW841_00830 [Deltaproteobacteria bacterium]|nr:hypothetical protein [Deltaproteobacteria bacterium]